MPPELGRHRASTDDGTTCGEPAEPAVAGPSSVVSLIRRRRPRPRRAGRVRVGRSRPRRIDRVRDGPVLSVMGWSCPRGRACGGSTAPVLPATAARAHGRRPGRDACLGTSDAEADTVSAHEPHGSWKSAAARRSPGRPVARSPGQRQAGSAGRLIVIASRGAGAGPGGRRPRLPARRPRRPARSLRRRARRLPVVPTTAARDRRSLVRRVLNNRAAAAEHG